MLQKPDVPLLDEASLIALLNERFSNGFKRLGDIPDPERLHNAKKAVERIALAMQRRERIALVGDYDVDGVVSTAIVKLFFEEIAYPLDVIIPNRFSDGYGVSPTVLERLEADVVITVDNGINAIDAANVCKARSIDLIITDHHTPGSTLPDAYTIVNPKLPDCTYPYKEICGAQVAWLLLGLLKKECSLNINMGQYLDLLALAVVADVMPLHDINRTIVQAGLKQLGKSQRPFAVIIREFLDRNTLGSEDIGFQIAPRINSAGRLEDASIALNFLCAKNTEEAYRYFEQLDRLNAMRKQTEAQTTEEAIASAKPGRNVIVVAGEGWHEGVVGIVASRLVGHFGRPAIVLSCDGDRAKGSARSIGEVNLFELINGQKAMLEKFGGHKMAAGLSLNTRNLEAFEAAINAEADRLAKEAFEPKEAVLGELHPSLINFNLLTLLEQYEPFGEGNPRPRFLIRDAEVQNIKCFGADRSHSRLTLRVHNNVFELIAFRMVPEMPVSRRLTCSYTLNRNEFNGKTTMQMMVDRIY